jgi:outer membrane protein
MFKKIVLFVFVMFPVVAFAQESQKIAYVNHLEVVYAMPEYTQMIDSLKKSEEELLSEIQIMRDDYTKKVSDYIAQQETLSEGIKVRRQQDIQGAEEKLTNFQQYAQQKQEELQQALSIPIHEKFQKMIEEVGKENNFLYILDSQLLRFISPNAVNATPLVMKKLGIQ